MARPRTDFTNIKCYVCEKGSLTSKTAIRGEYISERLRWKWICTNCYKRYYNDMPDSYKNIKKSVANCRTGNQNPSHDSAKGNNCIELSCTMYGYIDLNKKYDNYTTEIDCQDPTTGLLYQIRGNRYNHTNRLWNSGSLEGEWHKDYESMVCFCLSKDGKTIERIYKIPSWEIKKRKGISIYKHHLRNSKTLYWYEIYRVDNEEELKKANDIWRKILEKGSTGI